MPIRPRIQTDGITSKPETVITAPLSSQECAAFVEDFDSRATFDGLIADLERVRLRTPGRCVIRPENGFAGLQERPAYGSRAWYAEEILTAIGITRRLIAGGDADQAAMEAVNIGILAAEAQNSVNRNCVIRQVVVPVCDPDERV